MMMNELIEGFISQLKDAFNIGEKATIKPSGAKVNNVIITGLGGSGIGGSIVSELVANYANAPILVNKDYFLPAFVGPETLVIVSSFSGNTEETIQAMEVAMEKKCQVVCITSGGKIKDIAEKNNLGLIVIPGGDSPRAGLGYSFTQLFYILKAYNIINDSFKTALKDAIALLEKTQADIKIEAKTIAQKMAGKTPVIYTTAGYEGVAIRLRQQINENSKGLCWHHVIPEMNHNELVGWSKNREDLAPVILRNDDEYSRTSYRVELCKEIIGKHASITEIHTKGNTKIEKAIYMIHMGDWISWYLSELNNVDATAVKVITYLKDQLAKI